MVEQTKDAEELIKHVDENNKDIGGATRSRMRKENLWHRASFIFVINTRKELLVQKRTMIKDYCPGFYDLASAGGVVDAGEDDDVSAERELEEELGLTGYKLSKLFTFKHEVADNRVFGNFYIISEFDPEKQNLVLQESEVQAVEYWPMKGVLERSQQKDCKVTPCSIKAFSEAQRLGHFKQFL